MVHAIVQRTITSRLLMKKVGIVPQGKLTFNCKKCGNRLFESRYVGEDVDFKYCPYCGEKINGK